MSLHILPACFILFQVCVLPGIEYAAANYVNVFVFVPLCGNNLFLARIDFAYLNCSEIRFTL